MKKYKIKIYISLFAIILNIILPVANTFAAPSSSTPYYIDVKATQTMNKIIYDAWSRAAVKANFYALAWCSNKTVARAIDVLNDGRWGQKDTSISFDVIKTGQMWDGVVGEMETQLRDDFYFYLNGTIDWDESRVNCSYGHLVANTFRAFFEMSGDESKRWGNLSLEEKKQIICDTGWLSTYVIIPGSVKPTNCRKTIDEVIEAKGEGVDQYYFAHNGNGIEKLAKNYLNENLFRGGLDLLYAHGYNSSERYYVYRSLLLRKRLRPEEFSNPIQGGEGGTSLRWFRYVDNKTKVKNEKIYYKWYDGEAKKAYWVEPEISNGLIYFPDSSVHGAWGKWLDDRTYWELHKGSGDDRIDHSNGKDAATQRVKWLKANCALDYKNYYMEQSNYYAELLKGDSEYKNQYITWFNGLPDPRNYYGETADTDLMAAIDAEYSNGTKCFTENIGVNNDPLATCSISEILKGISDSNPDPNAPKYNKIPDLDTFTPGGEPSEGREYAASTSNSSSDATCMNGDNSLLWILCPILEGIAKASQTAYENYIAPALQINPDLIGDQTSSVNTATYDAWDKFRTMANIIFTIMILVVIFSQLTGYGIDNYGIKKLLPKLIIAAVLINLSFLICQLAVDLSNILGSGLNNLMNSMGNGLSMPTGVSVNGTSVGVGFGGVILVGVVILVAIVAISGNIAFLLPLLAAAISMAVAIFFLFVLLAVRQVGVIVLVVLSPIAFVCYMLPNAKKLFDKWLKAFEGLLLLYPICGLVVGGGNFVSKLILHTNAGGNADFFMSLISMIACIAPVFFIPVLLKGSFAAMGNIGATISGFGKRAGKSLGGKASKAVGSSDTFRRANNFVGRHTPLSKRRRAMAAADTDKRLKERESAQTILTDREFKNKTEAELQSAWNDAFDKGGDHGRLAALTNVMTSRYGSGAANFMAKTLANKNVAENKNAQDSMQILRNTMMTNSTLAGNMKNKASDAFQMISNAGITGHDSEGNTTYANLDYYSKNNAISKDVKDWSTQSSDTLKRAIENETLKQDTIEQILNSNDPSIQSGIQSDPSKAEVLQAAMGGAKTQADFESRDENGKNTFAEQYKAKKQQQINDAKTAEQKYREDTLDALNKINEQLGKH